MDAASTSRRALRAEPRGALAISATSDLGDRISRGTVAGVGAGLLFLLANMAWATKGDLPAVAPLLDISTIFYFDEKPTVSPEHMVVGLVTHLALSAGFGIAFALLTVRLHSLQALVIGAVGFASPCIWSISSSSGARSSSGSRRAPTSGSRSAPTRASACCWCRSF